jgi:hypothetical protein
MGFEVLVTMKITVFWDVKPCNLVDSNVAEETCESFSYTLNIETAGSSEELSPTYETTSRHIPEILSMYPHIAY